MEGARAPPPRRRVREIHRGPTLSFMAARHAIHYVKKFSCTIYIRASVDVLRHASKHVCPFDTIILCRNSKGMKLKIIFLIQEIINLMKYISQLELWIMCCLMYV